MPTIHKRLAINTYQGILENIEQWLNRQNAKLLSLAGRVTLTQSVHQALPIYSMQTTRLPTCITNKIDQACNKFIQCGNSDYKKMHLVGWSKLYQLKLYGGLGLKNLQLMNDTLLIRVGLGILSSPNSYWVQMVCSKYDFHTNSHNLVFHTRYRLYQWKALGRIQSDFLSNLWWIVGNGQKARCLWDIWVIDKPLYNLSIKYKAELVKQHISTNAVCL